MNLAIVSLLAKYPKLAGLSDMLQLKSNQLDRSHLIRIADAFGATVPLNEGTQNAFVALLKGKDINDVADMIQSPESVQDVVAFFTGGFSRLNKLHATEVVEAGDAETPDSGALVFFGSK